MRRSAVVPSLVLLVLGSGCARASSDRVVESSCDVGSEQHCDRRDGGGADHDASRDSRDASTAGPAQEPEDAAAEADEDASSDAASEPSLPACPASGEALAFERSCTTAADCAMVTWPLDCCGSVRIAGVRKESAFAAVELADRCAPISDGCTCTGAPASADDDTVQETGTTVRLECVSGRCATSFSPPPAATPCGSGECNSLSEVCVVRRPVGPNSVFGCEPVPVGCEAQRNCGCAAAALCRAPFGTCEDVASNQLACVCTTCQ
jgi:hypothetical protein